MKTFVFLVAVAIAVSGCATVRYPDGSRQRILLLQRSVIVQVTHTCTDRGKLYQAGRGLIADLTGAEPRDIVLFPAVLGDREVQATFQAMNERGEVAWTFTERFHIDSYSTTAQTWIISDHSSWSGGGRHSQCRR